MASEVKANKLSPATGTAVALGDSGDTFTVPSGATLAVAGTINSTGSSSGFDSGLASVQTFTSSGTWTRPSDITKVIMEVQGGGSSGSDGNALTVRTGQGASGGYAKKFLDVSSISTSTITVGAGGAAATSYPSNAGGASSWADGTNTITGNGGGAAGTADYVGGLGGTASGGDINIAGQSGGDNGQYGGGNSMFGFGGVHSAVETGNANTGSAPPSGYGSGSSGIYGEGTTRAGTGGIIVVWEYK